MVSKIHDFENSDLPEHVKAALRFTEGWVLHHAQTIDDAMITGMKAHFTEQQIVELGFFLVYIEGMHKFNAAFDIEALPEPTYQIYMGQVPAQTKEHMKRLGFSVVAQGISFNADRPAKRKALFVAEGDDVEEELLSRVRQADPV